MDIMKTYLILLLLMLAACNPTPTVAPSSPAPEPNIPGATPAGPAPQEVIPTSMIQHAPTAESPQITSESMWLQVLSPQDETVINVPQVDVIGSAPADAVVSVNEEILIVGDDQQFKSTVSLEEGPNLIEIVASDEDGNEMSLLLTVSYEP